MTTVATWITQRRTDTNTNQGATEDPKRKLGWPLTFIVAGIVTSVLAIAWTGLVWHYDQLITPRGQVTVASTTAGVMCFFLGAAKWWINTQDAKQRSYWLQQAIQQREVVDELGETQALLGRVMARQEVIYQMLVERGSAIGDLRADVKELQAEQRETARVAKHCAETLDDLAQPVRQCAAYIRNQQRSPKRRHDPVSQSAVVERADERALKELRAEVAGLRRDLEEIHERRPGKDLADEIRDYLTEHDDDS